MRPTFLGIPNGGEKGHEFAFPFPCICRRFAAKDIYCVYGHNQKTFPFGNILLLILNREYFFH